MAYVNVIGPKSDFDNITDKYLADYEIHLENAILQLEGNEHVAPFAEQNPYTELRSRAEDLKGILPNAALSAKEAKKAAKKAAKAEKKAAKSGAASGYISPDEACSLVIELEKTLKEGVDETEKLTARKKKLEADFSLVSHFRGLNYNLGDLKTFDFVAYRFGRIPRSAWAYFQKNSDGDDMGLFSECETDADYIWGVYFAPAAEISRIDSVLASLRFEPVDVQVEYTKKPAEICADIETELEQINKRTAELAEKNENLLSGQKGRLDLAISKLTELEHNFDARKYAVCITEKAENDKEGTFFLVCGWMRTSDAKSLSARLESEEKDVVCFINENPTDAGLTPPVSIKNRGIFKPYEMYVKMYGLPAYDEFDPTILISVLYSFMFGAMFGDLGHGLVLLIGGAALYFWKRSQLAGIISLAGFFSCIFGLLFGSFFGFEDLIPTLWLKPREAMSTLNFVGRINTVFALAVVFGMFLMLVLMAINVFSHIKQKKFVESIFSSNGIAGFVFYGWIVLIVLLYMTGHALPPTGVILIMVIVPLLLIGMNEFLTNVIRGHKPYMETGVGMYCVEAFFDLFETCLTYFSNSLSYVRIGAFAVSHAAMMEVVFSLTGFDEGTGSIIGLIFGNLFVIGFEGLIVGIQVLRLQYYEVFSKFYKGDGRTFTPFFKKRRNI